METRYCVICKSKLKPSGYFNKKIGKFITNIGNKKYCSKNCREAVIYTQEKDYVRILYECACDNIQTGPAGKHNHHFDYERPHEVIRLCPQCHKKEHARLRSIGAQPAYNNVMDIKIPFTRKGIQITHKDTTDD